jgi:predicted nucleic acid-binding protein
MTLVVDASIAAKWFVEEDGREQALHILDVADRQAPDLIVAEIANVIWKKAVRGQVSEAQARFIGAALPRYFEALHSAGALVESAIAIGLALRHPIHDCLYLACARRLGARLVTADQRLLTAIDNTDLAPLAVHIDAFVGG